MKTLGDLQAELRLARMLVEEASMAGNRPGETEPLAIILDVAVDRLREIGEAIEDIRPDGFGRWARRNAH